jgi:RNA polymerase sigma factor (TIGR02999 family)
MQATATNLFDVLYSELHRRAHQLLAGSGAHTINTTALVHEAFLKLAEKPIAVNDRAHYFRVAAMVMRQILIDAARKRQSERHGGLLQKVQLEMVTHEVTWSDDELLSIDQALTALRARDTNLADLVDLHYFAGLSMPQIGELRGCSERTVFRDWRVARAFLQDMLAEQTLP